MTLEEWNQRAVELRAEMLKAALDALPAECSPWEMRAIDGMMTGLDAWRCERGDSVVYVAAACNGVDVGAAWRQQS